MSRLSRFKKVLPRTQETILNTIHCRYIGGGITKRELLTCVQEWDDLSDKREVFKDLYSLIDKKYVVSWLYADRQILYTLTVRGYRHILDPATIDDRKDQFGPYTSIIPFGFQPREW